MSDESRLPGTPARIGNGRAGSRPRTEAWLSFRADHARARDAVHSEMSEQFIEAMTSERHCAVLQTLCTSREDFILNPPHGKRASNSEMEKLSVLSNAKQSDIQIVISDGLSASAVAANVPDLLPMLEDGLRMEKISFGVPVIVRYGRVAIGDQIAYATGARIVVNLIGERPGLSCATSLSAYITYNPGPHTISSDRTVVSNIHKGGTPPLEAGAYIVQLCKKILRLEISGVRLQQRTE